MSHYCSCMQGWSWRGWRGAAWWDSAGVWKVWQGGKCCHLPGKSIDGEKTKVVALTFNPNPSFFRKNKMTPMTLRCMSKFLWSSTRALRQKRPRMDLMEGKRFLFCTYSNESFQIFWRSDSVCSDLWSRDVWSARFLSLGNIAFSLSAELSLIMARS